MTSTIFDWWKSVLYARTIKVFRAKSFIALIKRIGKKVKKSSARHPRHATWQHASVQAVHALWPCVHGLVFSGPVFSGVQGVQGSASF